MPRHPASAWGSQECRAFAWMMGTIALAQGQREKGERLLREDIAILQEIGDRRGDCGGTPRLGRGTANFGRFAEGRALLEESLDIYTDLGHRINLPWLTFILGVAELHLGS